MAGCVAAGGAADQIGVVTGMWKCAAGVVLAEGASGDGIIVGAGVVIGGGVVSGNIGSRSADSCGVTVASTMSHGADAFGIVDDDAAAETLRVGLSVLLLLCPLSRLRRRPRRLLLYDGARSSLDMRRPRRLERL